MKQSPSLSDALLGDWITWMGLNEHEQNIFDQIASKLGTNVHDICEHIAKSNLSSFHPVDVWDSSDRVEIWMDVPGFKKDNLEVRIKDNLLIVSGAYEDSRPLRMSMKERPATRFKRKISLPARVTTTQCQSTLSDGVLHLSLVKCAPDEGVKINL